MIAAKIRSSHFSVENTVVDATTGGTWLVTGLWAIGLPRDKRIGWLCLLTGVTWFSEDLQLVLWQPVRTIGRFLTSAHEAPLTMLALSFPSGRLRSRAGRMTVGQVIVVTCFLAPAITAVGGDPCSPGCQPSWPTLIHSEALLAALVMLIGTSAAIAGLMASGLLIRRFRCASRPTRRYIGPLVYCATTVAALVAVDGVLRIFNENTTTQSLNYASSVLTGMLALTFPLGLLRLRLDGASMPGLMVALSLASTDRSVRDVLAEGLRDPTLDVLLADPASGVVPQQPRIKPGQAVTPLDHDGRTLGLLVHDETLLRNNDLLPAAASALALRIDNARLRDSRVALVDAADGERRRLERDLHDGAQQRLVTMALMIGALREDMAGDPELVARLDALDAMLDGALADVRGVSRGSHPEPLRRGGLGRAVRSLIDGTPLRIEVEDELLSRPAASLELTAWYAICEALANAGKHANATSLRVKLHRAQDELVVTIADDGCGGARPSPGSGLDGLRERIEARGGRLELTSEPAAGTTVAVRLPWTKI